MSTIDGRKASAEFKPKMPICGNCRFEKGERNEAKNRIDRTCTLLGCFVLMSSTCKAHEYRPKGA
jgi:hypothetical protein